MLRSLALAFVLIASHASAQADGDVIGPGRHGPGSESARARAERCQQVRARLTDARVSAAEQARLREYFTTQCTARR